MCWLASNAGKAWIEQKADLTKSKREGLPPDCFPAGTLVFSGSFGLLFTPMVFLFSGLHAQTNWKYNIHSSGSLACRLLILGLVSFYNYKKISYNKSFYMCIYISHTHTRVRAHTQTHNEFCFSAEPYYKSVSIKTKCFLSKTKSSIKRQISGRNNK